MSEVTFAMNRLPLRPKPTRGATFTVVGVLLDVRQCAV